MIAYFIQVAAFQLVFLMIYDAFLKKETFFNWNRIYLLSTAILSVVIPFIRLEAFKNTIPQQYIVNLPEVIIGNVPTNQNTIQLETVIIESKPFWTWENILYLGITLAALLFAFKIAKVILMLIKNPKSKFGNLLIINLLNSNAAFSFFHYIFLGERLNEKEKDAILKHEMVHAKEKHTFDLLFFEILRILFWFNPMVYMYQNRIMTLHEFIADQEAVKHQDKSQYYQNLLSQVFQTQNISFINPFFHQSLIKKRIVMLQKSKSKQIKLFKYVLLIPIVFGMLVYTSSKAQNNSETQNNSNEEITISTEYSFQTFYDNELKEKIYKEYLEYKNADEAKKLVENDLKDGILRLFVINSNNLTSKERERYNEKKKLIDTGDFFSQLIVSNKDENVLSVYFRPNQDILTKNIDDSKAVILNKVDLEVGFAKVDQVPVFPGCESLASREEKMECTSKSITEHLVKNFNTDMAVKLGLQGRQRITVLFRIDTDGNIIGVQSRAPHPALEAEAIRVINTLPKMIPGEHNGKKVIVPYSLPIVFMVAGTDETSNTNNTNIKPNITDGEELLMLSETVIVGYGEINEVPFAVIEQVPVFPGCEDLASNDEKRRCMSEKIQEFVNRNFNTDIPSENGLVGRQRITTMFKINTEGNIVDIKSRASHPALEAETIRVIKLLPKMQPGKQRGEPVIVPYSLPIVFVVQGDRPELENK